MYIDEYTEKVKEHFMHPRNMGEITEADLKPGEELAKGTVGNPACGDLMTVTIKVKDGKIADIKVKTFGCAAAIATASITTELVKGKTLEEAKKFQKKDAAKALGGLPKIKMHCSNLASEALHKAIEDYEKKHRLIK